MMFCKDNQADQRHCFKVLKCDKFFSQIFFGEKKIKPTSWSQGIFKVQQKSSVDFDEGQTLRSTLWFFGSILHENNLNCSHSSNVPLL